MVSFLQRDGTSLLLLLLLLFRSPHSDVHISLLYEGISFAEIL